MTRKVYVFADWQELGGPELLGLLHSEMTRGRETFAFEYEPRWVEGEHSLMLDPDLKLFAGPQYLNDAERPNFGLFLDSSPDRWGQLLMRRREAANARSENRKARVLSTSDFLLGVHDEQRMGALRFKTGLER